MLKLQSLKISPVPKNRPPHNPNTASPCAIYFGKYPVPVSACEYRIPSRRCADLLLFFPRHITLSPHNFRVLVQPVLVGQYPFSEPRFFLTCNMGDLSGSARFRPLFESALQAYEKETGIALAEHPLAVQLQSCPSAESITTVLQDQANAFSEFGGYCRIMRSVTST